MLSPVGIFATPWTIQSMGFPRPQYWSGEPFPSPGDLPSPGIEPRSSHCRWILSQLSYKGNPGILERKKESEVTQSGSILWDPMDCSLSGSSIRGIFQAGVLEWVAISFSRGSSWLRGEIHVSRIAGRCFTLWATREALWVLEWVAYPFSNGSSQSRNWTHSCNAGDLGSIPGLRRSTGEGNGNHSSILAWRIPWTEEPGGLQSMGSQGVRHDWVTFTIFAIVTSFAW